MRTSVLVLLALAAMTVAVLADDKCTIHEEACMDEGDACVGDYMTPEGAEFCKNQTKCCMMPFFCHAGTCIEDTRDANCTSNATDCVAAYYGTGLIACIKGKCVVQGSFNDSCTKDDHCAGKLTKCVKDKCSGLAVGDNCTDEGYQCGANMTCYNGKCVVALALGAACESSAQCDVYSICNDGKCIDRFSLEKGAKCTDPDACGKELYCYKAEQVCKETVKRQHIVCTKDEECSSYGNTSTCSMCDAITGEMYCNDPTDVERDCIAEYITAWKCYRKNGCSPVPSSSLDTCAQLECTAETNAIFTCKSLCEDRKSIAGKKCLSSLMLRYCPLIPTWLRIVIAFSILLVIIVVVFIIYGIYNCTRKNKNGKYAALADDGPRE